MGVRDGDQAKRSRELIPPRAHRTMARPEPGCSTLVVLALLAAGCGQPRQQEDARNVRAAPLRVAAASDLQTALPALARRFTGQTRVDLTWTFGASGQLAAQITQG